MKKNIYILNDAEAFLWKLYYTFVFSAYFLKLRYCWFSIQVGLKNREKITNNIRKKLLRKNPRKIFLGKNMKNMTVWYLLFKKNRN